MLCYYPPRLTTIKYLLPIIIHGNGSKDGDSKVPANTPIASHTPDRDDERFNLKETFRVQNQEDRE